MEHATKESLRTLAARRLSELKAMEQGMEQARNTEGTGRACSTVPPPFRVEQVEQPEPSPPRTAWPPECFAARERFKQDHAILFPLIGLMVQTRSGSGRLLQVTERAAAVQLNGARDVSFLPWQEVAPR